MILYQELLSIFFGFSGCQGESQGGADACQGGCPGAPCPGAATASVIILDISHQFKYIDFRYYKDSESAKQFPARCVLTSLHARVFAGFPRSTVHRKYAICYIIPEGLRPP